MLAYFQSTGNTSLHHKKLLSEKIEENLQQMKSTTLNHLEFSKYYNSILTPRIIYTTSLSSITKPQAESLTSKLLQTSLQKNGFHGSTPRGMSIGSIA
jgi:hypothetical protein